MGSPQCKYDAIITIAVYIAYTLGTQFACAHGGAPHSTTDAVRSIVANLDDVRHSFQPRQWFFGEGEPDPFVIADEDAFMWVYKGDEANGFTVGYYAPDGTWFPDSTYKSRDEAVARVRYLNGGRGSQ